MQPADVDGFTDVLKRLTRVFPFRGEVDFVARDYFKALQRYPLSSVEGAAANWLEQGKGFPKPADLIGVMPRAKETGPTLPVLTDAQAREYGAAEITGFEGEPCACALCDRAGVTHRFSRFVPEFTDEDTDRRVWDPIRQREITAGHWAHGDETRRWYAAKERFWALARQSKALQVMP